MSFKHTTQMPHKSVHSTGGRRHFHSPNNLALKGFLLEDVALTKDLPAKYNVGFVAIKSMVLWI